MSHVTDDSSFLFNDLNKPRIESRNSCSEKVYLANDDHLLQFSKEAVSVCFVLIFNVIFIEVHSRTETINYIKSPQILKMVDGCRYSR